MSLYDFLKAGTAVELLDKSKGELIFPLTPLGSDYSTSVIWGLEKLLGIRTLDAQIEFVHRRIHIGRTEQTVITFLDRASGRVHDAVLSKFLHTFFGGLPVSNALSILSDKTAKQKSDFARQVERDNSFISDSVYAEAWRQACTTARREILSTGTTACRNVLRTNPEAQVPILPEVRTNDDVSIYFLAFLILKVSLQEYFYFFRSTH